MTSKKRPVVEHLPSKHEVLSSNPVLSKKRKRKQARKKKPGKKKEEIKAKHIFYSSIVCYIMKGKTCYKNHRSKFQFHFC
jgi:hypothetical protein